MLQWTQIQATLSDQLTQARSFVTQYERFSETRRFGEQMGQTLDSLEREVSSQIDKLEQIVRDLLQIVGRSHAGERAELMDRNSRGYPSTKRIGRLV